MKEEKVYREEIEKIFNKPSFMKPYKELYPEATKTMEIMLFGMTLEEKEALRDKEVAAKVAQQITIDYIMRMTGKIRNLLKIKGHNWKATLSCLPIQLKTSRLA